MGYVSAGHIKMDSQENKRILNLFEYANAESFNGGVDDLVSFLDQIWINRPKNASNYSDDTNSSSQQFITVNKSQLKSKKYIGIIKFNGHTINLLPKIFYRTNGSGPSEDDIQAIQANVMWWLSYCWKIKFPKSSAGLSSLKSDFFEVLIYLFSSYTRQVLNNCLYQSYTTIDEELNYVKGRINMNAYITDNLSKARWHKVNCTFDSFEFDNMFNRIIKYIAKLLLKNTNNTENKRFLSDILFILDDVSDVQVVCSDCEKVKLNPLYKNLFVVLDYCRLFLANSITFSYKDRFQVFAFLLPMESVFEDFLCGFIEKHLKGLPGFSKLTFQKSDLYLAGLFENDRLKNDKVFNLKHDIYFEYQQNKIVVDAKYKIIYASEKNSGDDYKHGVSQSDLYQAVTYAVRRNARKIFLIYPQTIEIKNKNQGEKTIRYVVHDSLADSDIDIHIARIPIIYDQFPNMNYKQSLESNFKQTEKKLFDKLCKIFGVAAKGGERILMAGITK